MRKQVTLEGKIIRIGGYSADVHICVLLLDAGQGRARPYSSMCPWYSPPTWHCWQRVVWFGCRWIQRSRSRWAGNSQTYHRWHWAR